jgi:hypothetical protein
MQTNPFQKKDIYFMNTNNLSLEELFELRSVLLKKGIEDEKLDEMILLKERDYIEYIYEDGPGGAAAAASIGVGGIGVGYSSAAIAGSGDIRASQPSIYAGSTTGDAYTKGGGFDGSGDVSVPYNPSGRKKVFQKLSAPMSDRRGTSKRRKNKVLKNLKNIFANRQDFTDNQGEVKKSNIMDFDKFSKDQFSKVTKVEK